VLHLKIMTMAIFVAVFGFFSGNGSFAFAQGPVAITAAEVPFEIAYPASWYARRETTPQTEAYFFTREPVDTPTSRYLVGISVQVIYGQVAVIGDWESFKTSQRDFFSREHSGSKELSDLTVDGFVAFGFEFAAQESTTRMAYVKKGNDLVVIIMEAPAAEWVTFEPTYAASLRDFKFKNK